MAQISTNIVYSINRFKIPSDEIEIGEVFNPIASNFNGWTQYEENAKAYVEDGLLKFPSIEDDDINYSIIYNENIPNIIKIEFDWKVECTEDDSALGFSTSEIFDFMTGSVDWEHKIFEFKSASYPTFVFFKMEENSSGDGTGYFKNIVITTSNKIFEIKNGNYIRSKLSRFPTTLNHNNFEVSRFPTTLNHNNFEVSRFPTTLNHNNFEVSRFPTTLNHNNFKIKNFTNHNTTQPYIIKNFLTKSKKHYYRLGRDLTVPPKRIIFKNFED